MHTWSLSIEGQFYLILPFVWVLFFKRWRGQQTHIIFALSAIALTYFAYDTVQHTEQSFYSLPVRAWEFLAGACLVVLPVNMKRRFMRSSVANLSSAAGLICIFASMHFLSNSLLWPSAWTLLPIVGAVLVLLGQDAPSTRWFFCNWVVQRTGDMSYSLYLWHWPLIVFAKKYASAYQLTLGAVEITGLFVATAVLAFFSWRLIELPVRSNRNFWTAKILALSVVVLLLVFWGGWRWLAITNGLPERLRWPSENGRFTKDIGMRGLYYFKSCGIVSGLQSKLNLCDLNAIRSVGGAKHVPDFLVWGDSHAHQYYPAILKAAIDRNLSGVITTKAGCRPTLPNEFAYHTLENDRVTCTEFNNLVNKKIAETPSITTVILGRIWFHGESIGQTIKLTRALVAAGKQVVLVGVVPNPGFDVPKVWFERQVWTGRMLNEISDVRYKDDLPKIDEYLKKELAPELAQGRITLIGGMSHFCDEEKCYYVKDGVKNFVDFNHITEAKALEFTEEFKRALKE